MNTREKNKEKRVIEKEEAQIGIIAISTAEKRRR